MSVEPSEISSEVWTRWQGHVINSVYQLGRYLGCSDHSGVFLTKSPKHPSEVAIKLVPADRALAESLLPRWKRAERLTHPRLLRLFEWGGCQLEGLPYLYTVMEYADQTLAQLLLHRALTEDEAQEMLLPALDALAFLHERNLVHGQLKPANILVVGDQLKLASDTIRRVTEGTTGAGKSTIYDAPHGPRGSSSPADDIRALGISLLEALTRRPPSGSSEPGETITLPADLSPKFRDLVARCVSPKPLDRPSASELRAWAGGGSASPAAPPTIQPATPVTTESTTPEPSPSSDKPSAAGSETASSAQSVGPSPGSRVLPVVVLGAIGMLALSWIGWHLLAAHRTPFPAVAQASAGRSSPTSAGTVSDPTGARAPSSAPMATLSPEDAATSSPALHQVIPEISPSVRKTVRGHVKVWVRVTVDQDGSVMGAVVDRAGRSKYFQRLAVEAANEWTFPPLGKPTVRVMQVQFDFSRDGTTAQAVALQ